MLFYLYLAPSSSKQRSHHMRHGTHEAMLPSRESGTYPKVCRLLKSVAEEGGKPKESPGMR